jgi:hypothetical protein
VVDESEAEGEEVSSARRSSPSMEDENALSSWAMKQDKTGQEIVSSGPISSRAGGERRPTRIVQLQLAPPRKGSLNSLVLPQQLNSLGQLPWKRWRLYLGRRSHDDLVRGSDSGRVGEGDR